MSPIFETVSFHIVKPCNSKCKFCYATFDDMQVKMMALSDAKLVVQKLADAGVQKITFAGGEPLMYPHIEKVVRYSKWIGLTTGIVTNGFLLTNEFLRQMASDLDWIGLSIDSIISITNSLSGRVFNDKGVPGYSLYADMIRRIQSFQCFKLKINTVINAYNKDEYDSMGRFIDEVQPDRWKILRALRVEGQNDRQFDEIKVTDTEFENYVDHVRDLSPVVEDNEDMTGSYLLVDPQGRMFENSQGKHTYSDSLVTHDVDHCLKQINLNRDAFVGRGGLYNW